MQFAAIFIKKGWDVFFPFNQDTPIDLLIHKKGVLKRIQIKTTKPKNGTIDVKIRSTNNWQNKKYTKSEIDFIGVYNYVDNEGYLINMDECEGKSKIMLRFDKTKNNQKTKIRESKKYLFFSSKQEVVSAILTRS